MTIMLGVLLAIATGLLVFGCGWSFYADSGRRNDRWSFIDYYAWGCSSCGGAILGALAMNYCLGRL
mgnify:CR=1 FL=1